MSTKVIHVHCMPVSPVMDKIDKEEQSRNLRFAYQVTGCLSRLETLFDKARDVMAAAESCDFVEDIPALMSEIYLLYLRIGAIRKQLDINYVPKDVAEALPDVWAAQVTAEKILDVLSDLIDERACFGEKEEEEDGEDGALDGDDGDQLCVISIGMAERVPQHIIDAVYQGIGTVVTNAFAGCEVERPQPEPAPCKRCAEGCSCGKHKR